MLRPYTRKKFMKFKDKVVLITGAGRGYGRELAKAFAAEGARIAINDISPMRNNERDSHEFQPCITNSAPFTSCWRSRSPH